MVDTGSGIFDATLVNALAGFVIPALPDVTKIPEPSWEGWAPVLDALGVERSDAQLVANTVERAQQTLSGLLNAALYIDHTAASEPEVATYGQQQNGTDHQAPCIAAAAPKAPAANRHTSDPSRRRAAGAACGRWKQADRGIPGSAAGEAVLIGEPAAIIVAKAQMPSNGHMEVWYQLALQGYAPSDAEWYPSSRIQRDHAHGEELIAAYEAVHTGSAADKEVNGGSGEGPDSSQQLHTASASAGAASRKRGKQNGKAHEAPRPQQQQQQQQQQQNGDQRQSGHGEHPLDLGIPQLVDEHGNILQLLGPDGLPLPPEQAAAIAAQAIAAHQAAETAAVAEVGAKRGREGEALDQDEAGRAQKRLRLQDGTDLEVDGQVLHVVPLQVPREAAAPDALQQLVPLQLVQQDCGALPLQFLPATQVVSTREAIIQQAAEGLRYLMHSSEELARKKRQQARRAELNQRRALLLPGEAPLHTRTTGTGGGATSGSTPLQLGLPQGSGAGCADSSGAGAALVVVPQGSVSAGRLGPLGDGAVSDGEGLTSAFREGTPGAHTAGALTSGADAMQWVKSLSKSERRSLLVSGLRRSLPFLVSPTRSLGEPGGGGEEGAQHEQQQQQQQQQQSVPLLPQTLVKGPVSGQGMVEVIPLDGVPLLPVNSGCVEAASVPTTGGFLERTAAEGAMGGVMAAAAGGGGAQSGCQSPGVSVPHLVLLPQTPLDPAPAATSAPGDALSLPSHAMQLPLDLAGMPQGFHAVALPDGYTLNEEGALCGPDGVVLEDQQVVLAAALAQAAGAAGEPDGVVDEQHAALVQQQLALMLQQQPEAFSVAAEAFAVAGDELQGGEVAPGAAGEPLAVVGGHHIRGEGSNAVLQLDAAAATAVDALVAGGQQQAEDREGAAEDGAVATAGGGRDGVGELQHFIDGDEDFIVAPLAAGYATSTADAAGQQATEANAGQKQQQQQQGCNGGGTLHPASMRGLVGHAAPQNVLPQNKACAAAVGACTGSMLAHGFEDASSRVVGGMPADSTANFFCNLHRS